MREGLESKEHRPLYHSTLGSRVIKKGRDLVAVEEAAARLEEVARHFDVLVLEVLDAHLFRNGPLFIMKRAFIEKRGASRKRKGAFIDRKAASFKKRDVY